MGDIDNGSYWAETLNNCDQYKDKIESFQQRKIIKQNQMEILKLKNKYLKP